MTCYCSKLNQYLSKIPTLSVNSVLIASILSQLNEDGFSVVEAPNSLDGDLVNVQLAHSFLNPSQLILKIVQIGDVSWVHSLVQDMVDKSVSKNVSPIQFSGQTIIISSNFSNIVRNSDQTLTLPTLSKLFGDSVLSIHKNVSSIRNKIQSGISSVVVPCFDDYVQSVQHEKASQPTKHICFSYSSSASSSSARNSSSTTASSPTASSLPASPSSFPPSSSQSPSKTCTSVSFVSPLPNSSSSFPGTISSSSSFTSTEQVPSPDSSHSSFSSPSSSPTSPSTSPSSLPSWSTQSNPPVREFGSFGSFGGFGNSDLYPMATGVGSGNFMGNRGGGGGRVDPLRVGGGGGGGGGIFEPQGNLLGSNNPLFHNGFGNPNYYSTPDDINIPAPGSIPSGARFDPVGPMGHPDGRGFGRMFPGRPNPDGSVFGNNYFV